MKTSTKQKSLEPWEIEEAVADIADVIGSIAEKEKIEVIHLIVWANGRMRRITFPRPKGD